MPFKLYPPGTRKGNKFWVVRFRNPPGEFSTKATSRDGAEQFAAAMLIELRSQGRAAAPAPVTSFRGLAEKFIEARKPGKLDEGYIRALIAHFKETPVRDITPGDVHIAAHKLKPDCTNATKNRHVVTPMLAVMHFGNRERLCDYLRVDKFDAVLPEPKPLEADDAAKLLAACDAIKDPKERARVFALLVLLFYHGPRINEALALDWAAHVDMARREWLKTVSKKKGGPIERWKPMSEALFLALANLPGHRVGKVFPWPNRWAVYRALEPVVAKAGVPFTPHVARHTHAQAIRDAGFDDRAIQDALDHQSPVMARRYSSVTKAEQKKVLTAIGESFGGKRSKP
jgi:integrase